MTTGREKDPLKEVRQQVIAEIRPRILGSLGITLTDLTETSVAKIFPQEDGTTLECSAMNMGNLAVCSITRYSIPTQVSANMTLTHTVTHEFIGDSDISKQTKYNAFNQDGEKIDDAVLEAMFGAPMDFPSDELSIFDDLDFLMKKVATLNPTDGIDRPQ